MSGNQNIEVGTEDKLRVSWSSPDRLSGVYHTTMQEEEFAAEDR